MVMEIITLILVGTFAVIGGIPLCRILKIRAKGILVKARITNIRQTKKASGRSPATYTATLTFKDQHNHEIRRNYTSQGDYLSLYQEQQDGQVDLIFNKEKPNDFYLPKDKFDIGINSIYFAVGLFGTLTLIWIFYL